MHLIEKRMKVQKLFCFWSQVFFQLVKFAVEKWPTPGSKSGVFRYMQIQAVYYFFACSFCSSMAYEEQNILVDASIEMSTVYSTIYWRSGQKGTTNSCKEWSITTCKIGKHQNSYSNRKILSSWVEIYHFWFIYDLYLHKKLQKTTV